MLNISYCSHTVKCGLSLSTMNAPFTRRNGKSLSIVKLSIKAESLHLGCITKQKRLQGVYVQLLKGTQQISENAPWRQKRQKWHVAYISSCAVLVQSKWNRRGTVWDTLFVFLCVSVIMLVSAFMWTHMYAQEAACVQRATWAALAKLKGVNYPALFLAWDIILSLYKAEAGTGPLKPLRPIVLSLSDKWEAGVHMYGGFMACFSIPAA